jgi:hypothetical protein
MNFIFVANESYSEEEGLIVSLLVTRSMNTIKEEEVVSAHFNRLFGEFAEGHAIIDQEEFIQHFAKLLPPQIITLIQRDVTELPDEFEWYQQYFIKYSAS